MAIFLVVGAITALVPQVASAITVMTVKVTCPVGGEVFETQQVGSFMSFGQRPDGKAYGALSSFPLQECPGNHLVLYKEFSADEIGRLKPLVDSVAYRAMSTQDPPRFRAAWLARALGSPPEEMAGLLLAASWEADPQPALRRRYQREFIAAVDAMVRRPDDASGWWLRARAINAHRELGEFPIALAQANGELSDLAAGHADGEGFEGLADYLKALKRVIARRDVSSEPPDMVPTPVRERLCRSRAPKTPGCAKR